ncbi:MAG: DUF5668 domain-containing protein [Bryobacterales bacterium]|nr:DUF5668 domain-containing protein [Bryobacterales bacterium]
MTTQQASGFKVAREIPSLAPGLLILGAGVLLLLSQMDMIALEELWKLWPLGLILAGVAELEKWWKEQR